MTTTCSNSITTIRSDYPDLKLGDLCPVCENKLGAHRVGIEEKEIKNQWRKLETVFTQPGHYRSATNNKIYHKVCDVKSPIVKIRFNFCVTGTANSPFVFHLYRSKVSLDEALGDLYNNEISELALVDHFEKKISVDGLTNFTWELPTKSNRSYFYMMCKSEKEVESGMIKAKKFDIYSC